MPIDKRLTDEPLLTIPLTYSDKIHVVLPADTGQHPTGSSYQATMLQLATLLTKNLGNSDLTLTSARYVTLDYNLHFDGANNIKIGDNLTPLAKLHVKSTSGIGFRYDSATFNNIFYTNNNGVVSSLNGYWIGSDKFASVNNESTIIGFTNAHNNISINRSTFLGSFTGVNTIGSENTFIGYTSGWFTTMGSQNTFIGSASGENNTIGSENTFIGKSSGNTNTTGFRNITIGMYTGGNIGGNIGINTSNDLILIGTRTSIIKNNINNSIGLGNGHTITDSNQFIAGSINSNSFIKDIYFGSGVYSNITNQAVSVTNFCSANVGFVTGTTHHTNGNCIESIIRMIPGISTGTGTSGSFQVMSSPSGTSGNTPNSTFLALEVTAKGGINAPMLSTSRASVPIGGVYLGTDVEALANGDKVLILRMV